MPEKRIYSVMFGLRDYVGHIFQYHISIGKICELNNWEHIGLVPINCELDNMPKSWSKVLGNASWENKNLKQNIIACWKNCLFFKKFFKKVSNKDVIFIEHFSVFNVLSMSLAILFTRPKCSFWVLHRYVFPIRGIKTTLYKILNGLIERKVGRNKLTLFTDSDLLAKEQKLLFNKEVNVVPIPHTNICLDEDIKKSSTIDLWWPGGSVRWDKGFDYINLLSKQILTKNNCHLILAKSAKDKLSSNENIVFLATSLSSNEYYKLMKSVDIVLLPYIPEEYKLRTSGIFVEAITTGTKVITFKETWMAYELEKYDLNELAIKPEEFSIDKILEIYQLDLRGKFKAMVDDYIEFHSEKSFAFQLMRLSSS